jgi:hypothetical protein
MNHPKLPEFTGGINISVKIPPHVFEDTVRFYQDVIGLKRLEKMAPSIVYQFGENRLWLDRVDGLSQAELWLEIQTDDVRAAEQYLASKGVVRRDEIETLPEGFQGFWISSPASIIHLVHKETGT